MKIDVWSDFACPFCYIGKRRLEEALAEFPHKEEVELTYRSFELDPNAPVQEEKSIHEAIATKYGISITEAKRMNESVGEQAATVGLSFQFDQIVLTNTFDAHRLAHFAKTKKKDLEVTEQLLHAYFSAGKDISDYDTLLEIAAGIELNREEVKDVLHNKEAFANEVRTDETTAQQIGVRGVPYFVINQKYAISGAQPKETFIRALEKVWNEEKSQPALQDLSGSNDGTSCVDGDCTIPKEKDGM